MDTKQWAPKGNILDDFLNGGRKGFYNALFNQTPAFVMAFILIKVLNMSGLMAILGNVLSPIMGLFGLAGETGIVLITSWLSTPGAIAMMPALVEQGLLTGSQIAYFIPMCYAIGQQLQWLGRILAPIRCPSRYYAPIMIIGWILLPLIGWLGFALTSLLF
ncbi:MAG: nucleoside recognition domain-containing protein [Eubacteriales bacterium]